MSGTWGAPTTWGEVCRRAAGRKRYNATRKIWQNQRRNCILLRMYRLRGCRGEQAELAREFGVSPATISRDFQAIRNGYVLQRLGTLWV